MMTPLDQLVAQAAANAKANGYTFETANEMALDMCTCDGDLEVEELDDVEASIVKQNLI